MPGAYAHITLVNLASEPDFLDSIGSFTIETKTSILDYLKFCELGAVSPDYPYLSFFDSGAKEWADAMHYDNTGDMLRAGITYLQQLQRGPARSKGLAWLLGFAAHIAADTTIHPVVEKIVGPYKGNELAHRVCEMNQDAYIFSAMLNLGQIGTAEFIKSSGIATCNSTKDADRLDESIAVMWREILSIAYPSLFAINPPNPDEWHRGFIFAVSKCAEEGCHLPRFARRITDEKGLTYPDEKTIKDEYINGLKTPSPKTMQYLEVFAKAKASIKSLWEQLADSLYTNKPLATVDVWNLDTGKNASNKLIYWS